MSTLVKQRLSTSEAGKTAARILGLDDPKRAEVALAVAAAEELNSNSAFAARVRAVYGILPAQQPKQRGGSEVKTPEALALGVKPIKQVPGFTFDPSKPLDPYLLHEAYGAAQMLQLLQVVPLPNLKQSSALVEHRNPGTKPKSRSSKASMISYIMEHMD